MEMNGGFLVTKIKQLGDRIFEKILSEKNIDAFNGAQSRKIHTEPEWAWSLTDQAHHWIPGFPVTASYIG